MAEISRSLSVRLPITFADAVEKRAKAGKVTVGEWLRALVIKALEAPDEPLAGTRDDATSRITERIEQSIREHSQAVAAAVEEAFARRATELTRQSREALQVARQSMDRFARDQNDIKFALMASNSLTDMLMAKAEEVLGAVPDFFERRSSGGYGQGDEDDERDEPLASDAPLLRERLLDLIHAELFRAMSSIEGEVQRLLDVDRRNQRP